MYRDEKGWTSEFKKRGALWIHDGNPKRPHALLTSGKHSNGFFAAKLVIDNSNLRSEALSDLLDLAIRAGLNIDKINRVVGPATGATLLAKSLAAEITQRRNLKCLWGSPVKDESTGTRIMVFPTNDPENTIKPFELVLPIEDVMTTGESTILTLNAVRKLGGIPMSLILTMVNRGEDSYLRSKPIIALLHSHLPTWNPNECKEKHLCKLGSESISPKRPPENWNLLNKEY